jgi:Xaa-Pro dipeptidase
MDLFQNEFLDVVPHDALPFSVEEFQDRVARTRALMRENGVDILLVTTPENIYYLTGYRTTGYYFYQAFLLPLSGEPHFVVRRFEMPDVKGLSWTKGCIAIADGESWVDGTLRAVEACGGGDTIGYEERGFFTPPLILDGLRERLPKARLTPAGGLVESCRRIKSPQEITYIRKAAEIASIGMTAGMQAVRPGINENEITGAVYAAMMGAGGEYPSGGPYVVAGLRSVLTHQTAERTILEPGMTVLFEIGGIYRRYGSSLLRIAAVGKPSVRAQEIADVMRRALDALIAAIRPGVPAGAVDRAGRSIVEAAGLGPYWLHRAAYSMGISFPPGWGEGLVMDIKPDDTRPLEPGMIFHVVPSVHVPRFGAMGFSETVLVTENGCDVLTSYGPRGLVQCRGEA